MSWKVKCNVRDMLKNPKKGALNFTSEGHEVNIGAKKGLFSANIAYHKVRNMLKKRIFFAKNKS